MNSRYFSQFIDSNLVVALINDKYNWKVGEQ